MEIGNDKGQEYKDRKHYKLRHNTIQVYMDLYDSFLSLFIGFAGSSWLRARAFSSCVEQGLLLNAVQGILTAASSLAAERRLKARGLQERL